MVHHYIRKRQFSFPLGAAFLFLLFNYQLKAQSFSQSILDFNGNGSINGITSLMYGPDNRLYVAEYIGTIKILTIERDGPGDYKVVAMEELTDYQNIADHNDDGTPFEDGETLFRETIGLAVTGTATNPVFYVSSSDFRIGGPPSKGGDKDLDTNSGIITRYSWNGTSWDIVDIVRGLPRSEENHATNGLEFVTVGGSDYLIVAQGGNTNGGSASANFAWTTEYALSAAILSINLTALESMPIQDDNGRKYIYDIPTLDDPTRSNVNGIEDPQHPDYDGIDINDPFGGNDGLNQAMVVEDGPVQIFSPGYRNAYDLVVTESGAVYVTDNGANGGWGGFPVNEGPDGTATNEYDPSEPGSGSASGGEQINNLDHLQRVTNDINTYTFGEFYGGHPNPVRANPSGAGLYTNPSKNNTAGAVFRTAIYDPDGSVLGSTTDPALGLPANWPPVPLTLANTVEGDWRGPGIPNPDGPIDDIITIWGTNTNAIDEYTASNFDGAMQGDLIAGVNTGLLRRVELNPDGTLETLTDEFASGFGGASNALGLTCNGDSDPFPGTIWVGTLVISGNGGKIIVLEPQDFIICLSPGDPGYDANEDYDIDGYTNLDEEQNGTDPCNGGSQPNDFDKSANGTLISDLNDDDDDNDGILDADDPFQLGNPEIPGSDAFTVPVENELFSNTGLGGYLGLGLTGLMNNGDMNPNWINWLDRRDDPLDPNPNDILGGAIGAMTMQMTSGTALGTTNTQEKGFQYGVTVDINAPVFKVQTGLLNFHNTYQLYHPTSPTNGELGIFMGDGTQSNYIKFVLTQNGLLALQEIDDIPQTPIELPIAVGDRPNGFVLLYIQVDPATGEVLFEYSLDGADTMSLGTTMVAQGAILEAIQDAQVDLAVGMIGSSNSAGQEVEGTWDFLNVTDGRPVIQNTIADVIQFVGDVIAPLDLNTFFDDDGGVGSLTYEVVGNTDPLVQTDIIGSTLTITAPATPVTSDIIVRATDLDGNFAEQQFTVIISDSPVVLYRVNSGGPQIAAIDGGMDWEEDSVLANSPYLSEAGVNGVSAFSITNVDTSVNQATTPLGIFASERNDDVAGSPDVTYSFPVAQSGNYEVRLYFANGFAGTGSFGERLFHVEIEDRIFPALYEIDLSGTYGHATGTMISHVLEVTDGNITVKLQHSLLENPLVNGIEILKVTDGELPIYVGDLADQLNLEEEPLDGSLLVNAAGGDGNLNYSASGLPPGLFIEPTNGQIGGTISPGAAANSPYTVTVVVDDGDGSMEDQVATNFMWTVLESDISFPVLRINAGGAYVSSTDLGADWQANATSDAFSSSLYSVNTGAIYSSKLNYANRDASIPSYIDEATYNAIFAKERYDRIDGEEMEFKIPLTNGYYIANLYLGNSYSGTNQAGDRIFDILIEGNLVRDNLDLIPEFGHKSGGMLSFPVLVSDGELNIGFLHQVENPLINAIEILGAANLGIIVNPIADQVNDEGEQLDGTLTVNASGGEGALSFSATGLPPGIAIEPSNGQLFGTIEIGASTNSPYTVSITVDDSDTTTTDAVTVDFTWSVQPVDTMSWIDKDENENYTARHECSFTQAGDKFYLMGGRENSKTLDVYDYTSNTWTSLEDSAPLEFNHFQATEYKGLIWVIGSFKDNNFSAGEAPAEHIWAFDPANEEWIQGPEIPVGRRRGSSGLVLYNDKFYVVGGNTNGHKGGFVSWFDEYDPSTGIWTPLPDAPRERDHFHAALIGDKLYAAGGRLSGGPGGVFKPLIAEVDVYDFTSGSWSTLPMDDQNKLTPRAAASVVNFGGKLMVIGGEVEDEIIDGESVDDALKITEAYDPLTGTWTRLSDLNFERHGTQAIVSGDGIHITSGSPSRGGGNQKNMEYLGIDAPIGAPSIASTLSAPPSVFIADETTVDFDLSVSDGNVGIIISSLELTGPDAVNFTIVEGALLNQLLSPDTSHTLSIALTGTGPGRSAILTVNYGAGSTLDIPLSNENLPPNIDNPGTQQNQEGDAISLQINAFGEGNSFTYTATGLPPTLNIDPATGLITGTIDPGTGGSFLASNGLVVVEAESGNLEPSWSLTTNGGATGIVAGSNHFNNRNGGTIPYDITITSPGVYRFNWRSHYSGSNSTEENDNWLRFPNNNGVWFFGYRGNPLDEASMIANLEGSQNNIVFPKGSPRISSGTTPEGSGGQGYFKVFRTGGFSQVYNWRAVTSDEDDHDIYVRFENAGTYRMEISERSAGHAIDKFALYKLDGTAYSNPTLTAAPESQFVSNGASQGSPYNVEVTVTSDNDPTLSSSITFLWNITSGINLGPTAVVNASPEEGDAPLEVNFTGSGSTDDIGIASYQWDFGDGSNSTEADPTHTFTVEGIYEVSLTVFDGEGLSDTASTTITVLANQAPVAIATATPQQGNAPLEVSFTASNSTDDVGITGYLWDFGDGDTSTEANPVHTFTNIGTYEVSLTVTDEEGLSDTITITIVASDPSNNSPIAVVSATPEMGDAPLLVSFMGSDSTDDFGIVSYLWDFGDGSSSSEADPTHTYVVAGDYTATLTVTDAGGLSDIAEIAISVSSLTGGDSIASFILLDAGTDLDLFTLTNGLMIDLSEVDGLSLNVRAETDPETVGSVGFSLTGPVSTTATESVAPYALFGDRNGNYKGRTLLAGEYTLTGTPYSGSGLSGTPGQPLTVQFSIVEPTPNQPTAIAIATPLQGKAPLEVSFTGSGSVDNVGIVSYLWDFQDGNTSIEADPVHIFTDAGVYPVALTVTDNEGLTDTVLSVITVNANQSPTAVALASPVQGSAPLEVTFTGSGSTDDSAVVSYFWDFKDGNTSTEADPVHIFTTVGTYEVALMVTDLEGLVDTTTIIITVADPANEVPVAIATATPDTGDVPLEVSFTGSGSTDDSGIVSYFWDFKDGNTSTMADPVHIFTESGSYAVSLTVSDAEGLSDTTNVLVTVNSIIVPDSVVNLILVDAGADTDLFTLIDGQQINMGILQGLSLNIRAETNPGVVGSVQLSMTGPVSGTRTESVAPYALFGDNGGNYRGRQFVPGAYTVNATPYSGSGLSGTMGQPLTIQFSVVDGVAAKNTLPLDTSPGLAFESDALQSTGLDIQLFPNPASFEVMISMEAPMEIKEIHLFDMNGRLVKKQSDLQSTDSNLIFDLSGIQDGIYFMRITTRNALVFNHRLAIEK